MRTPSSVDRTTTRPSRTRSALLQSNSHLFVGCRGGADLGRRAAGRVVEARHRVHAVAVSDGRGRRVGRGSVALHALPQFRETDPGAADRPGATGSRRRGDRDRIRLTPPPARPARAGAKPPGRGRTRPRTTSSAARSRRGSSTTAPGSTRRCCSCAANAGGRPRGTASRRTRASRSCSPRSRGGGSRGRVRSDGRRRLRRRHLRLHARAHGVCVRPARANSTADRASRTRCARGPSSCVVTARPTPSSCAWAAGCRRVGPRDCCAPPATASASRSRWKTERSARSGRRLRAFLEQLGLESDGLADAPLRNSRGEVVGSLGVTA